MRGLFDLLQHGSPSDYRMSPRSIKIEQWLAKVCFTGHPQPPRPQNAVDSTVNAGIIKSFSPLDLEFCTKNAQL
jgi:hypothetical protein